MIPVLTDTEFISKAQSLVWTFAKTMPEDPHEYIVRDKTADDDTYIAMFNAIEACGEPGDWKGTQYKYLRPGDGYRYWKMTENVNESIIINRAKDSCLYTGSMKVKYVGPDIGATGLYDGNIYEVSEICKVSGALRVIDEDQSNWNYNNDPNWKPGYLYSPTAPCPMCVPEQKPGKFYIIEDVNGQLAAAGVPQLPAASKET